MNKPKYKIGQTIVGRPTFQTKMEDASLVMVEIESACYESRYGHWIYCGTVQRIGDYGLIIRSIVKIYEYEIEYKVRGK